MRLGELLVKAGAISDGQLRTALNVQKNSGGRLGDILVGNGALSEMILAKAIAKQTGFRLNDLSTLPSPQVAKLIPQAQSEKLQVLAVAHDAKSRTLSVAFADPIDQKTRGAVARLAGVGTVVEVQVAPPTVLRRAIQTCFSDIELEESGSGEFHIDAAGLRRVVPAPKRPPPPPQPSVIVNTSDLAPVQAPDPGVADPFFKAGRSELFGKPLSVDATTGELPQISSGELEEIPTEDDEPTRMSRPPVPPPLPASFVPTPAVDASEKTAQHVAVAPGRGFERVLRLRHHEVGHLTAVPALCQEACEELLRQAVTPGLALAHFEADVRRSLSTQPLRVRVHVAQIAPRSFRLTYTLTDEAGQTVATASSSHELRAPGDLPEPLRRVLAAYAG